MPTVSHCPLLGSTRWNATGIPAPACPCTAESSVTVPPAGACGLGAASSTDAGAAEVVVVPPSVSAVRSPRTCSAMDGVAAWAAGSAADDDVASASARSGAGIPCALSDLGNLLRHCCVSVRSVSEVDLRSGVTMVGKSWRRDECRRGTCCEPWWWWPPSRVCVWGSCGHCAVVILILGTSRADVFTAAGHSTVDTTLRIYAPVRLGRCIDSARWADGRSVQPSPVSAVTV